MTSSETTFNDAELIESLRLWNRDDAADRIEALTKERDQWIAHAKNAIWADSEELKEAEAYAEDLEKELNTCRMAQAVMDNTVADLEAKLAKAVEAGVDVAASLNAATSLLERGGKRAAASDKMFDQMLMDYNASLDRFRATLAEIKGESHE